jgi:ribosomal protein L3 glutamine methyltransferase
MQGAAMPTADEDLERELITLRDWLRYAVSRFNAAGLAYGHGTATALDEAAYLLLHTLHLPIDQLDPWLDARLAAADRRAVREIIDRRIATRKPAPYLTNEAWVQGHAFYVDERVIVPRSYIGELLGKGLAGVVDPDALGHVLDLGTGSGCLAILAALAFPSAQIDAGDVSEDALAVAGRNVADYGLQDQIRLIRSDLFAGLGSRRYDLILANPPYVGAAAMADFPPEYAAEPRLAHAGGADGLDLVRRILAEAADHLAADGAIVIEVGTGRPILELEYPRLPFLWLDTAESEGEVFALPAAALRTSARR